MFIPTKNTEEHKKHRGFEEEWFPKSSFSFSLCFLCSSVFSVGKTKMISTEKLRETRGLFGNFGREFAARDNAVDNAKSAA